MGTGWVDELKIVCESAPSALNSSTEVIEPSQQLNGSAATCVAVNHSVFQRNPCRKGHVGAFCGACQWEPTPTRYVTVSPVGGVALWVDGMAREEQLQWLQLARAPLPHLLPPEARPHWRALDDDGRGEDDGDIYRVARRESRNTHR